METIAIVLLSVVVAVTITCVVLQIQYSSTRSSCSTPSIVIDTDDEEKIGNKKDDSVQDLQVIDHGILHDIHSNVMAPREVRLSVLSRSGKSLRDLVIYGNSKYSSTRIQAHSQSRVTIEPRHTQIEAIALAQPPHDELFLGRVYLGNEDIVYLTANYNDMLQVTMGTKQASITLDQNNVDRYNWYYHMVAARQKLDDSVVTVVLTNYYMIIIVFSEDDVKTKVCAVDEAFGCEHISLSDSGWLAYVLNQSVIVHEIKVYEDDIVVTRAAEYNNDSDVLSAVIVDGDWCNNTNMLVRTKKDSSLYSLCESKLLLQWHAQKEGQANSTTTSCCGRLMVSLHLINSTTIELVQFALVAPSARFKNGIALEAYSLDAGTPVSELYVCTLETFDDSMVRLCVVCRTITEDIVSLVYNIANPSAPFVTNMKLVSNVVHNNQPITCLVHHHTGPEEDQKQDEEYDDVDDTDLEDAQKEEEEEVKTIVQRLGGDKKIDLDVYLHNSNELVRCSVPDASRANNVRYVIFGK
jgi:hypothetical protein